MANMSYCRFENTFSDLGDCVFALNVNGLESLSERERGYAEKMYRLCQDFIDTYEDCEENPEDHREEDED